MATYGAGTQGGQALENPKYENYVHQKTFPLGTFAPGVPLTLDRVTGHQKITIKYGNLDSSPSWTFYIKGGSNTTQSEVLPMFPNMSPVYNQSINYVPAEAPQGCTVEVLPIPSNSTRINRFRVTSLFTFFVFDFAWSPFCSVPPTITFPPAPVNPAPLADDVTVTIVFFRTPPNMRTAGIPISFGSPDYQNRDYVTNFVGGPNPLDDMLPHNFRRFNGQQQIVVTNLANNFFFSFGVDYGINGQAGGYLGLVNPNANARPTNLPTQNCSIIFDYDLTITVPGVGGVASGTYQGFIPPANLILESAPGGSVVVPPLQVAAAGAGTFTTVGAGSATVGKVSTKLYQLEITVPGVGGVASGTWIGAVAPTPGTVLLSKPGGSTIIGTMMIDTVGVGTFTTKPDISVSATVGVTNFVQRQETRPVQDTISFYVNVPNDPSGLRRIFLFTFTPFPYNQLPPTIQLVSGPGYGANSVEVKVVTEHFTYV